MPDDKCECGGTYEYPDWFSPASATMPPPMECSKCGKKRDIPEAIANDSEPMLLPKKCECGGESEVYEVQSITKAPNYYLTFCTKCLTWAKHGPGAEHERMGALPDAIRKALDERGEKVHSVLPPPETSSLTQEEVDGLLNATDEVRPLAEEPMVAGPANAPDPLPGNEPGGPVPIEPAGEPQGPPLAEMPVPPDFPPMDDPMRMEQGCVKDCIYCTQIYPDIEKCPRCGGSGPKFTPARMMDEYTSRDEIMAFIIRSFEFYYVFKNKEPTEKDVHHLREDLIRIIDHMYLYHFDAKEAFKEHLYRLDQQYDIDPNNG